MATTNKEISLVVDTGMPAGNQSEEPRKTRGLQFTRNFTRVGATPNEMVEWETRDAVITNEKAEIIFEQKNVEVPAELVADGDQHRGLEVLPRHAGHRRT